MMLSVFRPPPHGQESKRPSLLIRIHFHAPFDRSYSSGGEHVTHAVALSNCLLQNPCASQWMTNKSRLRLEHLLPIY